MWLRSSPSSSSPVRVGGEAIEGLAGSFLPSEFIRTSNLELKLAFEFLDCTFFSFIASLKVLPGSEAYKIGYEAGRTFRSNISYNDEFINQWIPDARKMLDELGQSSENMTKDMIGQIADSAWTSAALEAGIMENSPENRADFRRGMIDGYFN